MDFKQLRIFLNVCDYMSFTETAKQLNYAQSTISESISNLEKSLDTKLFERIGNKIFLSESGKKLKLKGQSILILCDDTVKEIKNQSKVTIRIGIIETLCSYKFPGFFKTFLDEHPNVTIEFEIARCEEFLELIRTNKIDVGFTLDEVIAISDIKTVSLFDEEIVFIASPESELKDLNNQKIIVPEGDTGYMRYFHDVYRDYNYKKGATIQMESIEGIKSYVKSGFGISFIPLTTVAREVKEGSLKLFRPEGNRYFHEVRIIHHKNKHLTPELEALIESAVNQYKQ